MKYRLSWLLVFTLVSGTDWGLIASPELRKGVSYVQYGDRELHLDLALPAEAGRMRPAILFIHGGGWRGGNRKSYETIMKDFAEKGYVCATMSYRFSQEAIWPAQRDDITAALKWLNEHSCELGIDPERIGVTGASAGGHLSLMLGTLPRENQLDRHRVRAVVNFFGPTDLSIREFLPDVDPLVTALAGGTREEKAEVIRDFSPVTWIDRTDAPVLTFHGTDDPIVPINQARVLHEKLDAMKIPNRLEIIPGGGHGWGGAEMAKSLQMTLDFFDQYLKGSDDPLLYSDDFDSGYRQWTPTDPSGWRWQQEEGNGYLDLFKKESHYKTKVRSPFSFSLLKDLTVSNFTMDVDMRSTHEVYGHQDLCLFFGYQDPSHFYYIHLGREADPHANSIFLVNDAPRVSIAEKRTDGTDWSRGWHRVRVNRDVQSGNIRVYFDDMIHPVMETHDKTFLWGQVGVGSFDDIGSFDNFRLHGIRHP